MNADLSRRVGQALYRSPLINLTLKQRMPLLDLVAKANQFDDLPEEWRALILESEGQVSLKHLGGKHDQKTHGRRGGQSNSETKRRPTGTQIGSLLTAPKSGPYKWRGAIGDKIKEAVNLIDSVHGDGDEFKKTPLLQGGLDGETSGTFGSIRGRATIKVSDHASEPMVVTAHETGHALDKWGFQSSDPEQAQRIQEAKRKVAEAVAKSRAVDDLRRIQGGGLPSGAVGIDADMAPGFSEFFDPAYSSYLLEDGETWARAYAQYIALRSGSARMKGEVDAILQRDSSMFGRRGAKVATARSSRRVDLPNYPRQWQWADFEPIAAAFDQLMLAAGYITEGAKDLSLYPQAVKEMRAGVEVLAVVDFGEFGTAELLHTGWAAANEALARWLATFREGLVWDKYHPRPWAWEAQEAADRMNGKVTFIFDPPPSELPEGAVW